MNVLDLFSGIGGFSLGLERAGFKTVAFCEIDPFCQQVSRHYRIHRTGNNGVDAMRINGMNIEYGIQIASIELEDAPSEKADKCLKGRQKTYCFDGHPDSCPKCKKQFKILIANAEHTKSGNAPGQGQWKIYCGVCGVIYYDLLPLPEKKKPSVAKNIYQILAEKSGNAKPKTKQKKKPRSNIFVINPRKGVVI